MSAWDGPRVITYMLYTSESQTIRSNAHKMLLTCLWI